MFGHRYIKLLRTHSITSHVFLLLNCSYLSLYCKISTLKGNRLKTWNLNYIFNIVFPPSAPLFKFSQIGFSSNGLSSYAFAYVSGIQLARKEEKWCKYSIPMLNKNVVIGILKLRNFIC